jgi:hypothetical protein
VDVFQLQIALFLLATAILILVMLFFSLRLRRKTLRLGAEIGHQRDDSLRSIKYMLQQMDYDAEVLRLLRHARNTREAGRTEESNGAIDTLIKKENEMMERVDRVNDFERYLRKTYDKKSILPGKGKSEQKDQTPEQIKEDIRVFIGALENIRGGDKKILEEKIAFFEKWVESPRRQDIHRSLTAMVLFLEKGDSSGLEELKK